MYYGGGGGGGCYVILSKMHGMALDVQGCDTSPGTKVIMYDKSGNDNQLFYDDPSTGTIRTKLNGFCLHAEGDDGLKIMPYEPGNPDQEWMRELPQGPIRNRRNPDRVFDIYSQDQSSGATVGAWSFNGQDNQMWDYENVGGGYGGGSGGGGGWGFQRREMFIVSNMHAKVLDVRGGDTSPGTDVIMWTRKDPPERNQLWYADHQGYIHSALNDFALDAEADAWVKLQPFNGGSNQQWTATDDYIINRGTGEVLDIAREDEDDGAGVCSYSQKGGSNQKWMLDYV